jgi:hypothetical protein
MKLKRPSGANDYDTLADIDGESQLVRDVNQHLSANTNSM